MSKLLFSLNQGKIYEMPCNQNASELFFEIEVKINLNFLGKVLELPWNQGFFCGTQTAPAPAFYNLYSRGHFSQDIVQSCHFCRPFSLLLVLIFGSRPAKHLINCINRISWEIVDIVVLDRCSKSISCQKNWERRK